MLVCKQIVQNQNDCRTLQGGYPLQLSPGDKRRGNVVWRRRRWRRGNVVGKRSKKLQLAGRGPWMNGFCKDIEKHL